MARTTVLNLLKPIRSLLVRGRLLDDDLELIDSEAATVRSRLAALEAGAGGGSNLVVTYDGSLVDPDA